MRSTSKRFLGKGVFTQHRYKLNEESGHSAGMIIKILQIPETLQPSSLQLPVVPKFSFSSDKHPQNETAMGFDPGN